MDQLRQLRQTNAIMQDVSSKDWNNPDWRMHLGTSLSLDNIHQSATKMQHLKLTETWQAAPLVMRKMCQRTLWVKSRMMEYDYGSYYKAERWKNFLPELVLEKETSAVGFTSIFASEDSYQGFHSLH